MIVRKVYHWASTLTEDNPAQCRS